MSDDRAAELLLSLRLVQGVGSRSSLATKEAESLACEEIIEAAYRGDLVPRAQCRSVEEIRAALSMVRLLSARVRPGYELIGEGMRDAADRVAELLNIDLDGGEGSDDG